MLRKGVTYYRKELVLATSHGLGVVSQPQPCKPAVCTAETSPVKKDRLWIYCIFVALFALCIDELPAQPRNDEMLWF
jgi:hypothetical protein